MTNIKHLKSNMVNAAATPATGTASAVAKDEVVNDENIIMTVNVL